MARSGSWAGPLPPLHRHSSATNLGLPAGAAQDDVPLAAGRSARQVMEGRSTGTGKLTAGEWETDPVDG